MFVGGSIGRLLAEWTFFHTVLDTIYLKNQDVAVRNLPLSVEVGSFRL